MDAFPLGFRPEAEHSVVEVILGRARGSADLINSLLAEVDTFSGKTEQAEDQTIISSGSKMMSRAKLQLSRYLISVRLLYINAGERRIFHHDPLGIFDTKR